MEDEGFYDWDWDAKIPELNSLALGLDHGAAPLCNSFGAGIGWWADDPILDLHVAHDLKGRVLISHGSGCRVCWVLVAKKTWLMSSNCHVTNSIIKHPNPGT
jgi:hypothetical protein